jgi:hypothetical protein
LAWLLLCIRGKSGNAKAEVKFMSKFKNWMEGEKIMKKALTGSVIVLLVLFLSVGLGMAGNGKGSGQGVGDGTGPIHNVS